MSTTDELLACWLYAYTLLTVLLQVPTAILFFRDRHASTWLALIGSLAGAPVNLISLTIGLYPKAHSEHWNSVMHNLSYVSALGLIMFAAGMLWIALRHRTISTRIAELEQIIAAQNSRLQ